MNKGFLSFSVDFISGLSEATQTELAAHFFPKLHGGTEIGAVEQEFGSEEEGPADLTVALCRKLIAQPIHEKTLAVLRFIAEQPTPEFQMSKIVAAVPDVENYLDLKGAWSGLTRRTRNILNDSSADLIWWFGEPVYDGTVYVDQAGRVSPLTHQSLRTALGIR